MKFIIYHYCIIKCIFLIKNKHFERKNYPRTCIVLFNSVLRNFITIIHEQNLLHFRINTQCFSQSGCCKPPSDCNFTFRNATFWIPPAKNETAVATNNGDCGAWSNVQTELCFNCNACKAGVLANIREKWRHLLVFNICLLIFLITVYSCGCCARRNN